MEQRKVRKFLWKCIFTECNYLGIREVHVQASSLVDAYNKLCEDLNVTFVDAHLLGVDFLKIVVE